MFSSTIAVPVRIALTRMVVADWANRRLSFDSRAREWRKILIDVAAESVMSVQQQDKSTWKIHTGQEFA